MDAGQQALGGAAGFWQRWRTRQVQPSWPPEKDRRAGRAYLRDAIASAIEKRRLFVLLPFALIAGLVCYAALPDEPPILAFIASGIGVLSALMIAIWQGSVPGLRAGIQCLALWLGFCLLPLHGLAFGTPMLIYPAYGTYDATVDEVLSADGNQQRLIVSNIAATGDARPVPIRRARLLLPSTTPLQPGDKLRARLRLAPIPGPILPGAHDGQFHSYFIGVGAYGSAIGDVEQIAQGDSFSLARLVQGLRDAIGKRIDTVLSDDTAAIGKAMVVGDQSAITDDTREVMAASGLAHIYSISGLHLSIVAGGLFWLLRLALASVPALVGWPVKQIAAVTGIVAAFLYLLLAGGVDNVPAFRSTLMLALIFGAVLAGRQALTMRNVAIAAILIILIDPSSIFRPSFQLSFAAVVGLIGVYELPRRQALGSPGRLARIGGVIGATAWTSFIAGLATLLFSAYHFQQTAPLGVIGNLLALPFVSLVIMPFGVLSVLSMPLGLETPFLSIMGWGIDRMVDIAELVAGWSQGWTGNPLLATWTLGLGLLGLAWFAFIDNRWRLVAPMLAAGIILLLGFEQRPDVLIADSTQAVAIRDGEGLALGSGRTGSFAVDVWSQHFQTEIAEAHPGARCDELGCIVTTPDFSIAIVRNAAAFAEDCGRHNLLIARIYPPKHCFADGQVIGPAQLASGGVHRLSWNQGAGQFDIRPAIESLNRPWRVSPR
ncbi:ComEC family competence protein [Devosia sp. XJ19-1]|uniref:ComEC family competence protein n=1 Tax=Devosia ureilytica TaxID=2952754 RepID=A0A9Q4FRI0_9HYPH|nr:ComEC/Rec2 family competence protein [Devosia ureilytica]MCP8882279.1 ComEC family competence protein [Devosia ureilytica]MCP8885834.1 ComEC family competence protein [Devosia ureilytica]